MGKKIYVDMDGTLAVFKPCEKLEILYEEGYFKNLEPQEVVVDAVRDLCKNPDYEVYVLSAVLTDSKYALKEKNEWLDKYLPEIPKERRVFPPCGEDKKKYVDLKEGDFLLDDYTKNLIDWEPPGTAIKLLNGINHTNETWEGNSINGVTEKEIIVDKINAIASGEKIRDVKPQAEEELNVFIQNIKSELDTCLNSHFFAEISGVRISVDRIAVPFISNISANGIMEKDLGASLYSNKFFVKMQVFDKDSLETIVSFNNVSSIDELADDIRAGYKKVKTEEAFLPKHRKGR